MAVHELFAFNLLTLTQTVTTNIKGCVVEQHLTILQSVRQNIETRVVHDHLYLTQSVKVQKILNLAVAHALSLSQGTRPRVLDEGVYQFLSIQQDVVVEDKWPLVHHRLELTQEAEYVLAKGAYSVLTLTQSVDVKVTRNLTVSHTLVMESTARAYKPDYYFTSFPITVVEP